MNQLLSEIFSVSLFQVFVSLVASFCVWEIDINNSSVSVLSQINN